MTDSEQTLQADISNKIKQLCKQGYEIFDRGDAKAALRCFYSAWTLLPKPQTLWQEAGWVLTALGDVYFAKGDYEQGREALLSALHCPHALGNPIIHLRLGQCLYELRNETEALDQFRLVVKNGGEALFQKENKKYLQLLESAITD